MEKQPFIANTDEEIRMVFDPFRVKIIFTVQRSVEPLTVKEIATILNEPANKVHYHVKKLFNFGFFELVKTKNVNGIIAKYYSSVYSGPFFGRATVDSNEFPVHMRHLTSLMDTISEKFKNDIVSYSNLKDESGNHPGGIINLAHVKMYMTPEEASEVVKKVSNIITEYTKVDESKEIYTTVQTIARIKL